jgi:uncharacterized membrane protein YfcA
MEALWLIGCGSVSGLLAGMLGIGGGLVVVPVLYLVLGAHDVDDALIPHIAVATSLAAMIPTTFAASVAQARRGVLDWGCLRCLLPGIVVGSIGGAVLAGSIRGVVVSMAFVAYASCCAVKMLARAGDAAPSLPTAPVVALATGGRATPLPVAVVGAFIGASSAIAGLGGALLTVPYLLSRAVDIKRAVAASSAVSLVIASVTTLANLVQAGQVRPGEATFHLLGPVYWPAAILVGTTALLCAPCGVAWSHRLPMLLLRRIFAVFTLVAAAGTLASVLR